MALADHRRLNAAVWRFERIHQSLWGLIGIYDRYSEIEGRDSRILADILTWMEDQMEKLLTRKKVTSIRDGELAVEAGIRCGENCLTKL
jgi:hypothetical protein